MVICWVVKLQGQFLLIYSLKLLFQEIALKIYFYRLSEDNRFLTGCPRPCIEDCVIVKLKGNYLFIILRPLLYVISLETRFPRPTRHCP